MKRDQKQNEQLSASQSVQYRLREKANLLNLSAAEIARQCGEAQSTIYRLLHLKTTKLSFALVCKVAKLLKVSLMEYSFEASLTERPIHLFLGLLTNIDDPIALKTNSRFALAELISPFYAEIFDECAIDLFRPGAIVKINPVIKDIVNEDVIVIRICYDEEQAEYLPFKVYQAPDKDQWLFLPISNEAAYTHIFTLTKSHFKGVSNTFNIEVIGTIEHL